jgi:hypothetical protein
LIREALEYLVGLKSPSIHNLDGKTWTDRPLTRVRPDLPECIKAETLTGIVDYITQIAEQESAGRMFVHIVSKKQVNLATVAVDGRRWYPISAHLNREVDFKFGIFYTIEEFVIKARSSFVADAQTESLLKFVAMVTEENNVEIVDNGTSQRVTIKDGVSIGQTDTPNGFAITVADGWPDIDSQARSAFIRVRKGPQVALFVVSDPSRDFRVKMAMKEFFVKALSGMSVEIIL